MNTHDLQLGTSREKIDFEVREGIDAFVVAGVPRVGTPGVEEDAYPATTFDVLKIMRADGARIDYVDPARPRVSVDLKAAEVWAPIVVFTSQALSNGLGGVLTAAFLEIVGNAKARRALLHARVGKIRTKDTEIEWLDVDGPAESALKAIDRFLSREDD